MRRRTAAAAQDCCLGLGLSLGAARRRLACGTRREVLELPPRRRPKRSASWAGTKPLERRATRAARKNAAATFVLAPTLASWASQSARCSCAGRLRPAGDERRAWRCARGEATQDVRDDACAAKSSENAWRNRRRLRTPRRTTGARWTRRPRCGRELARTEWGARRASRAGALTKDLSGHNGVPRRVWGVAASLSSREKAQISYRLISLFQRVSARADACHRCARL